MPRTRAQRRHALATALDEDTLSYVLSFLPKLGVVPGRLYTLAGGARAKTGKHELSLKAILAPRRRRLIKCPDDIPLLENAVAAAREGDVVLLTESVELQAPIVAPPFHVTIAAVSRRRFGRYRSDNVPPGQHYSHGQLERALGRPSHGAYVYVNRNRFSGGDGEEDDSDGDNPELYARDTLGAVVASGADVRLELRWLAWVGEELDEDVPEDPGPLFLPFAIDAQAGARVDVENCWLSSISRAALRASSGASIYARDLTIGLSSKGVMAYDDGSVIVENCLLKGNHIYGGMAHNGGRIDVRSCRIDCCFLVGFCARGAGSHIRIRKTVYMSRLVELADEESWTPRFTIKRGGCVTFSATENETYRWASTEPYPNVELVEGDGGDLEGFEDLSGGEPEPVLSLTYEAGGAEFVSRVRLDEPTETSNYWFDGSSGYRLA